MPAGFVGKKHVTMPFQSSDKFKLASFQKDSGCHNNNCICLVNKDDINKKYFCQELKDIEIPQILFMPEKNQLFNIELIAYKEEIGKISLTIVPSEIAKKSPDEYFSSEEALTEAAFSEEISDETGQGQEGTTPPEETVPPTESLGKGAMLPFDSSASSCTVSSTFAKLRTILGKTKYHSGIDYRCKCGTNIYAAADGTAKSRIDPAGYGNYVFIEHQNGVSKLYGHLQEAKVSVAGKAVKKGDLIGISGNTGKSTGCHLHFEVRHAPGTTLSDGTKLAHNAVDPNSLETLIG